MKAETLLGHYRIIREIARSNDIVYEALDMRINRRVAIKELLLPAGITDSVRQDRIQRFMREARAAGQLTHPNIVTVYEAEEDNGRYFIVMEYLEGETLRDRLQREGKVPLEEAIEIVEQVLEALIEAHSKGVIHRDIKPENIHLLPDGWVKLTDFGIARLKFEPSLTIDGQIFGTPSYMSPEQIMGHEIDERSDLFSVGIVFYEMLTGVKPFTGDSVVSITYAILNTEPPSPAGIPYGVEWVIRRALQKSPANRFSSAQEMKKGLQEARESLKAPPMLATPMAPSGPTPSYPPTGAPSPTGTPYSPAGTLYPTAVGAPTPPPHPPQPPMYIPPPPPPKPLLSPAARHFLGTVLSVVLIGLALMGLVGIGWYAFSKAYERYTLQKEDEKLAAEIERAEQLYNQGRYKEAAERYYQLLPQAKSEQTQTILRRNLVSSLIMEGNRKLKAGALQEAAQFYETAVQYEPQPAAYVGLAQVAEQQGQWEEAVNRWLEAADRSSPRKAREYKRRAAQLLMNLAEQDYRNGLLFGAVEKWLLVMQIAPGTEEAGQAQRKIDRWYQERFRFR